jgi:hypothetical protein
MNVNTQFPGSARVSRVGFGVAPKQAFLLRRCVARFELLEKVRDRGDALANTPEAWAPRTP